MFFNVFQTYFAYKVKTGAAALVSARGDASEFGLPAGVPRVVGVARSFFCRGQRKGLLEGGAEGTDARRNLGGSADEGPSPGRKT